MSILETPDIILTIFSFLPFHTIPEFAILSKRHYRVFTERIKNSTWYTEKVEEYDQFTSRIFSGFIDSFTQIVIPEELRTRKFWYDLVDRSPTHILIMPCGFATKKFWLNHVEKYPGFILRMPREFLTNNLCTQIVSYDWASISDVPHEFLTNELCELAISCDDRAAKFIPPEFNYQGTM